MSQTNKTPNQSRSVVSTWNKHRASWQHSRSLRHIRQFPHSRSVLRSCTGSRRGRWSSDPRYGASPGWGTPAGTRGTAGGSWRRSGSREDSATCNWIRIPWKGGGSWFACWSGGWCPECPSDSHRCCPRPRPGHRRGTAWTVWWSAACRGWSRTLADHRWRRLGLWEEHCGQPKGLMWKFRSNSRNPAEKVSAAAKQPFIFIFKLWIGLVLFAKSSTHRKKENLSRKKL